MVRSCLLHVTSWSLAKGVNSSCRQGVSFTCRLTGRTGLFESCRLSQAEREELLDIFLATCAWTRIYYAWRPNLPDEADNHLVELAVAGSAQFIVTRNLRDVARMEIKFPELRVVSPEDFLKEIAS